MEKLICKLDYTLSEVGDDIDGAGSIKFEGGWPELVAVFADLFSMFKLDDEQATLVCAHALEFRRRVQKEENT